MKNIKNTPQYSEAVKRSKKNQEGQKRLSHEIWWAQYEYTQGRSLATKVQSGELQFENLNENEQKLVGAFESRQSAKALDRLLEKKLPPYRAVGTEAKH